MATILEQYDTLLSNLNKQLARGGMSYGEAVIVDDLISILAAVQSEAAGEPKPRPPSLVATPQPPRARQAAR